MPTERNAQPLAEFMKFKSIGTRVIGRVTEFKTNDNGTFIVMSPALVKVPTKKEAERFGDIAVGLTADLKGKVASGDIGRWLVLALVGEKASAKGAPTKLFRVLEVDKSENLVQMIHDDALFSPVVVEPKDDDTEDDLPF